MMAKLSIIVPVYKVEAYLRKCIESLLNQTFKDFELILVDDGSPDKCPEICDEYASLDSRVQVIHQNNMGVSRARNIGLENASGEWIGFVDSDDYLDLNAYEELLNIAEGHNCDVAIMDFAYVDEEGNVIKAREYPYSEELYMSSEEAIFKEFDIPLSIRLVMWNKIFKREVIGDIRYKENLKASEDTLVLHECLKRASKVVWVRKPLYFNVQRPGSAMRGALKIKDFAESLDVHLAITKDIKKNYPDIYNHALKYYIDCCVWKMRSQMPMPEHINHKEQKMYKYYLKDMKKHILSQIVNIVKCHEMSWKEKIVYILIGVKG